jgi:hypothetical protein
MAPARGRHEPLLLVVRSSSNSTLNFGRNPALYRSNPRAATPSHPTLWQRLTRSDIVSTDALSPETELPMDPDTVHAIHEIAVVAFDVTFVVFFALTIGIFIRGENVARKRRCLRPFVLFGSFAATLFFSAMTILEERNPVRNVLLVLIVLMTWYTCNGLIRNTRFCGSCSAFDHDPQPGERRRNCLKCGAEIEPVS